MVEKNSNNDRVTEPTYKGQKFLHPIYTPLILIIILLIILGLSLLPKTLGHPRVKVLPLEISQVKENLLEQISNLENLIQKTCEELGLISETNEFKPILPADDLIIPKENSTEIDSSDTEASNLDLSTYLDELTVIVEIKNGGSGSGFFVDKDLILTNSHVLWEINNNEIYVSNKKIGRYIRAELVFKTPQYSNTEFGKRDYAILKLIDYNDGPVPKFTNFKKRMQSVYAAGYPGAIIMQNSSSEIPESVITVGRILQIQNNQFAIEEVLHQASIAPGNSGGPLVDECGRIIGINTFLEPEQNFDSVTLGDRYSYALSTTDMKKFLGDNQIDTLMSDGACNAELKTDNQEILEKNKEENTEEIDKEDKNDLSESEINNENLEEKLNTDQKDEAKEENNISTEYTIFRTLETTFKGKKYLLWAGHNFPNSNAQSELEWTSAWCYFTEFVDGLEIKIDLLRRPTRNSSPGEIRSSIQTLDKVGLSKQEAKEIALKCPWADKGES